MRTRRQFLKDAAGASAGMFFVGSGVRALERGLAGGAGGAPCKAARISIGRRRIKTVDVHSHIALPEAAEVLKGTRSGKIGRGRADAPRHQSAFAGA